MKVRRIVFIPSLRCTVLPSLQLCEHSGYFDWHSLHPSRIYLPFCIIVNLPSLRLLGFLFVVCDFLDSQFCVNSFLSSIVICTETWSFSIQICGLKSLSIHQSLSLTLWISLSAPGWALSRTPRRCRSRPQSGRVRRQWRQPMNVCLSLFPAPFAF